jgi:two-component system NtrC family sensor kinase
VAHEINNPLYAARNSLYLVEQDLPADAPERQFLEIAQGELGRIARIITRMRDFYRPARAELELTSINDTLLATIELVQTHLRHGQVDVATDLATDLPQITAHTDQIRQVFLNLMLNACDAMPNGGTLRITSHAHAADIGRPAEIVIQIADTGVGIAPEHRTHLFEPFYTTKAQGTGLGLAISAHIITQHGGQIDLASEVGLGTTFTIRLPVAADLAVL